MDKPTRAEGIDVYIQFLNVALTHAKEDPISQLDANEIALLETVALREFANESTMVTEVMASRHLGSPATLHRRLSRLRKLGVLEVHSVPNDTRIKYLRVSPLVHDYFARMGKALLDLNQKQNDQKLKPPPQ